MSRVYNLTWYFINMTFLHSVLLDQFLRTDYGVGAPYSVSIQLPGPCRWPVNTPCRQATCELHIAPGLTFWMSPSGCNAINYLLIIAWPTFHANFYHLRPMFRYVPNASHVLISSKVRSICCIIRSRSCNMLSAASTRRDGFTICSPPWRPMVAHGLCAVPQDYRDDTITRPYAHGARLNQN